MAKNDKISTLTIDKIKELDRWSQKHAIPVSECRHCGWKYYLHGGTIEQQVQLKCEQCGGYLFPKYIRDDPNPRCPACNVIPIRFKFPKSPPGSCICKYKIIEYWEKGKMVKSCITDRLEDSDCPIHGKKSEKE